MEDNVKFSENVILIDVAFLNDIACNARTFFSARLGRELPDVDLPAWLSYLALDAGLREGNNEIQVLLVHDDDSGILKCCVPSELAKLNGMACRTPLGEFQFASVPASGMISCEELYLDLMNLALDSSDVKRLMLVPFHPSYAGRVGEELCKYFNGKSNEEHNRAFFFVIEESAKPLPCPSDSVFFSLSRAFGIKSEEMQ